MFQEVFKRELRAFFKGMSAYLFGLILLVTAGIYGTIHVNGGVTNFEFAVATAAWAFMVAIPVLSVKMHVRMWALDPEHPSGKEAANAKKPFRFLQPSAQDKQDAAYYLSSLYDGTLNGRTLALGRFAAHAAVLLVPCLILLVYPLFTMIASEEVYLPSAYGTICAFFFLGLFYLSLTEVVVAREKNQVLSVIYTLLWLVVIDFSSVLAMYFLSSYSSLLYLTLLVVLSALAVHLVYQKSLATFLVFLIPEAVLVIAFALHQDAFEGMAWQISSLVSPFERFLNFAGGEFDITALIYFLGLTVLGVLTAMWLCGVLCQRAKEVPEEDKASVREALKTAEAEAKRAQELLKAHKEAAKAERKAEEERQKQAQKKEKEHSYLIELNTGEEDEPDQTGGELETASEESSVSEAAEDTSSAAEDSSSAEDSSEEDSSEEPAAEEPAEKKSPRPLKPEITRKTIVVTAAAVIIITIALFFTGRSLKLDVTSTRQYTNSEAFASVIDSVDKDVTIYWMVQNGSEDPSIRTLLDLYQSQNRHLKVIKLDPLSNQEMLTEHISADIYNNSMLLECDGRYRFVDYNDMYDYDYSRYEETGTFDLQFNAEDLIGHALSYVTGTQQLPVVYTITGHGETDLPDDFKSALEDANYLIDSATLTDIPDDASILIMNLPASDISAEEQTALRTYLAGGGDLVLETDGTVSDDTYTLLYEVMKDFGLAPVHGLVVESVENSYDSSTQYVFYPTMTDNEITSSLISTEVLLSQVKGLELDNSSGAVTTSLLVTSDESISKLAGTDMSTYEKEEGDIDGPFTVSAVSEKAASESGNSVSDDTAKVFWTASSALLSEEADSYSGGNFDFVVCIMNYMDQFQDDWQTIDAKVYNYGIIQLDELGQTRFGLLFIGLIPLLYLVVGIVLGMRQRATAMAVQEASEEAARKAEDERRRQEEEEEKQRRMELRKEHRKGEK